VMDDHLSRRLSGAFERVLVVPTSAGPKSLWVLIIICCRLQAPVRARFLFCRQVTETTVLSTLYSMNGSVQGLQFVAQTFFSAGT
jgi:hypothetical protein